MKRLIYNIIGLRKYFRLATLFGKIPKSELLGSNESLKAFGKLWSEHPEDVMLMATMIEYEFGRNQNYTTEEIASVKKILAEVIKFFKDCSSEWKDYAAEQERRKEGQDH